MADTQYIILASRAVLIVSGEDRSEFLQGLISNDINQVSQNSAIWAALLTPQGKYLHDFFIVEMNSSYYLDCEGSRRLDLSERLARYRLRSKVELNFDDSLIVVALTGRNSASAMNLKIKNGSAKNVPSGIAFVDPRLAKAGVRIIGPKKQVINFLHERGFTKGTINDYELLRLSLGLSDGARDLVVEKSGLLEGNFEELNGLNWEKGCYIGQELTARTKYRGLVRRRLIPVSIKGESPTYGTPILVGDIVVGEMRSSFEGVGLAILRLDRLKEFESRDIEFVAGTAKVTPEKPSWARY